jgi:membrane-bound metal-dependent hydrolase YbcI (DUF457 family)
MMARSHTLIGMAAATTLAAAGFWPISLTVLIAAFAGSLAPDIDHPYSTLGRPLFFLSYPLNAAIGHRAGTHSILALAICAMIALYCESAGFADVGYAAHIAADLITIEGCAILFPGIALVTPSGRPSKPAASARSSYCFQSWALFLVSLTT